VFGAVALSVFQRVIADRARTSEAWKERLWWTGHTSDRQNTLCRAVVARSTRGLMRRVGELPLANAVREWRPSLCYFDPFPSTRALSDGPEYRPSTSRFDHVILLSVSRAKMLVHHQLNNTAEAPGHAGLVHAHMSLSHSGCKYRLPHLQPRRSPPWSPCSKQRRRRTATDLRRAMRANPDLQLHIQIRKLIRVSPV
jgi:hypothetical protein